MSVTLAVEVTGARSERVPADLLVATFFAAERPLRGAAARLDWRLCGLLSAQLVAGRLTGAAGEAALVPSPRCLRSRRLLLLGLGARPGFGAERLSQMAADAAGRAVDLRTGVVAVAVPDELATGLPADRRVTAIVQGVAAALAERPFPLHLALIVPPAEARVAAEALAELSRSPGSTAVPLRAAHGRPRREPEPEPARPAADGGRPLAPAPPPEPAGSS